MKKILMSLFFLISMIISASELVQVNGELTGAGKRFPLSSLKGFIHESQMLPRELCEKIVVKKVESPKVSDIEYVVIEGEMIPSQAFEGFYIQQ